MGYGNDGNLYGAGYNAKGGLGTGNKVDATKFVKIFDDVKHATIGDAHIMAVKQDGSLWAVGGGIHGELGEGNFNDLEKFEKVIWEGVERVSAGKFHTAALKEDGSLWTTGDNRHGQLGNGIFQKKSNEKKQLVFVKVIPAEVKDVYAGGWHTAVLKKDGSVWTVGKNTDGALGDGSKKNKNTFVKVIDGGVIQVSAGEGYTMAVKTDGSLWVSGESSYGRIGKANTSNRRFVQVVASGVKDVAAAYWHSFLLNDKDEFCGSGRNAFGPLAVGHKSTVLDYPTKCIPRPPASGGRRRLRRSLSIKIGQ